MGFTSEGRLTALDIDVYSNAGYSIDFSVAVSQWGFYFIIVYPKNSVFFFLNTIKHFIICDKG